MADARPSRPTHPDPQSRPGRRQPVLAHFADSPRRTPSNSRSSPPPAASAASCSARPWTPDTMSPPWPATPPNSPGPVRQPGRPNRHRRPGRPSSRTAEVRGRRGRRGAVGPRPAQQPRRRDRRRRYRRHPHRNANRRGAADRRDQRLAGGHHPLARPAEPTQARPRRWAPHAPRRGADRQDPVRQDLPRPRPDGRPAARLRPGLDRLRPPRLTGKPLTGTYRTAIGRNVRGGRSIPRADLAHYMLAVLDQPKTIGRTIGIAT